MTLMIFWQRQVQLASGRFENPGQACGAKRYRWSQGKYTL